MKPTTVFMQALGSVHGLDYQLREVVHLKDGARRLVDYSDTAFTRRARRELCEINEAFRSVRIDLVAPDVDWRAMAVHVDDSVVLPSRTSCYRVFNGGWRFGGRAYGGFWQGLGKARRLQLTIDGIGVIEHDFPQLHPRLLYAELGLPLGGDAYTIRGYEDDRPRVKLAWQMLFNAKSRRAAVLALAKELGGFDRQADASHLLDALESHHKSAAGAFYKNVGLRLQRRDSDLMMKILQQCLAEGIVGLPIHDSLIVAQGPGAKRAEEIMQAQLSRLLT
jgi:hypothetical protein